MQSDRAVGSRVSPSAEYEWVGGRDVSQYSGAQIIHCGTVANARQIMTFDAAVSGDSTATS